ncbi:MAG: tetratricopeptide repeat protein [Thermoanaerobaculia bacterium]
MKAAVAVVALAASIASWPFFRAGNSARWTEEGRAAFAGGRFEEAIEAFGAAEAARPHPVATYNRGTALVGAGDVEKGVPLLESVESEPAVATDALFNRGNAAFAAAQWDAAIARYEEVLRRDPSAADAKRNLEIALRRRQAAPQEQEQGQSGERTPEPRPGEGGAEQPVPSEPEGKTREQMSPEEILRAIAQQEREELQRMRRARAGARRAVGW